MRRTDAALSLTDPICVLPAISIRKRHTYRIVVSDLLRRRAIWLGGKDRSEASLDEFYAFLGKTKAKRIHQALDYRTRMRASYTSGRSFTSTSSI
jgi:hypothetical protein